MREAAGQVTGRSPEELVAQIKELIANNKLGAGAALGGLGALILGTGAGRSLAGSAVKLGGLALIGGLAYKAYQNYQQGLPPLTGAKAGAPQALLAAPSGSGFEAEAASNDQATLLIRAMIAAAAADGRVDAAEQKKILSGFGKGDLDADARQFLARELEKPATVDELAEACSSPEEGGQSLHGGAPCGRRRQRRGARVPGRAGRPARHRRQPRRAYRRRRAQRALRSARPRVYGVAPVSRSRNAALNASAASYMTQWPAPSMQAHVEFGVMAAQHVEARLQRRPGDRVERAPDGAERRRHIGERACQLVGGREGAAAEAGAAHVLDLQVDGQRIDVARVGEHQNLEVLAVDRGDLVGRHAGARLGERLTRVGAQAEAGNADQDQLPEAVRAARGEQAGDVAAEREAGKTQRLTGWKQLVDAGRHGVGDAGRCVAARAAWRSRRDPGCPAPTARSAATAPGWS